MCSDSFGTSKKIVEECLNCSYDVDEDGVSDDICGYEDVECMLCGRAPCTEAC